MNTTQFSKSDLLKTFLPLCEGGKNFLEFLLIHPKTSKVEGRGFFNDIDFLLEACTPHLGRYNFCLSHFAFAADKIPTRAAFNQFDRSLLDAAIQEQGKVHSLSVCMLFKPELIREMTAQAGNADQFLNIIYQIDAILSRLNIKNYSIDYFLTGVVLRFLPTGALQSRPLNKSALQLLSKYLLDLLEKKMSPPELKRFALSSSALGKIWDPAPGLAGLFAGENTAPMIVTSSGALEPAEDAVFLTLFEDVFEPKKKSEREAYGAANTRGLSQNWQESEPEPSLIEKLGSGLSNGGLGNGIASSGAGLSGSATGKSSQVEKNSRIDRDENVAPQVRQNAKQLVQYFQSHSQGKWRWPLYSNHFNRLHNGVTAGELLLLQSDSFAAEMGFQFLMQCAESFIKEGQGQLLLFSKKRSLGDVALSSLSRHFKTNPLTSKSPHAPDAATLTKAYSDLFPNPPQVPLQNRSDDLEEIFKYLEHDYLLQQKKKGTSLPPLVIVIDNLAEFSKPEESETFRLLSQIKMHLHEFNGSLWVTQFKSPTNTAFNPFLALADHFISLDHDGALENAVTGKGPLPQNPIEWDAGFHAEFSTETLLQEFSLLKLYFKPSGSHRSFAGHYAYHRPSLLFHEIGPAPITANVTQVENHAGKVPTPSH